MAYCRDGTLNLGYYTVSFPYLYEDEDGDVKGVFHRFFKDLLKTLNCNTIKYHKFRQEDSICTDDECYDIFGGRIESGEIFTAAESIFMNSDSVSHFAYTLPIIVNSKLLFTQRSPDAIYDTRLIFYLVFQLLPFLLLIISLVMVKTTRTLTNFARSRTIKHSNMVFDYMHQFAAILNVLGFAFLFNIYQSMYKGNNAVAYTKISTVQEVLEGIQAGFGKLLFPKSFHFLGNERDILSGGMGVLLEDNGKERFRMICGALSGELRLSIHNVQNVMIGANFLRIDPLLDECGTFLRKRLKPHNAISIFLFCRSIDYKGIESTVHRFIEKHFVLIATTPDFLEMTIDDIVFVLQRDGLYIDKEEQVFEAAMKWIEHDAKARRPFAARLLSCVRLPLLEPSFLSDSVAGHDVLKEDIRCRDLVDEAKDYHLIPERRHMLKSFRTSQRVCRDMPGLIFAMGGLTSPTRHTRSLVEVYDPLMDTWSTSKPMNSVRSRIGVAVHEWKIYALGGFDGKDRLDLCEAFDTLTNEWITIPNLRRKRSAMSTAVLDGIIYVCGGYDGISSLACVETYDPRRKDMEWKMAPSMMKQRSASGSATVDGMIYVIGGHDGMQIFTHCERFSPELGCWEELPPMLTKRCRLGVATLNGKIYAAGGYDGSQFLNSVESYDPEMKEWKMVSAMHIRRCRVSLAVSCGRLYAIGGFDGLNNLSSCEVYDPEKDSWELRSSLKEHAGGVSVGVVPIPADLLNPTPPILKRKGTWSL